jgi:hypothetical protein
LKKALLTAAGIVALSSSAMAGTDPNCINSCMAQNQSYSNCYSACTTEPQVISNGRIGAGQDTGFQQPQMPQVVIVQPQQPPSSAPSYPGGHLILAPVQ